MTDPDTIERLARALCISRDIDPDHTGYAIREQTRETLGESYKLWEYWAQDVRVILANIDSI